MLYLQTPGGGDEFYRHASEPPGPTNRRRPTFEGFVRQLLPRAIEVLGRLPF